MIQLIAVIALATGLIIFNHEVLAGIIAAILAFYALVFSFLWILSIAA
jgi:hypothetical protein